MATYEYRCEVDGAVDVRLPMGSAPPVLPCPTCAREATRRFSAPRLSRASSSYARAIERTERSSADPEVVTSVPSAGRRRPGTPVATNPALQRLPRP